VGNLIAACIEQLEMLPDDLPSPYLCQRGEKCLFGDHTSEQAIMVLAICVKARLLPSSS
jgi:hypothetical protein